MAIKNRIASVSYQSKKSKYYGKSTFIDLSGENKLHTLSYMKIKIRMYIYSTSNAVVTRGEGGSPNFVAFVYWSVEMSGEDGR